MTNVPDRVQPHELRASDADRERVAAVLRTAAAEGRLDLTELDERLAAVYAAKTYGELEPLLRDLPAAATTAPPVPHAGGTGATPTSRGAIAVMGGFRRTGRWVAPRTFTCLAFWGGGSIDLREAVLSADEVRIRAFAVMGGIEVIVPENANLLVNGVGIMGGFDHAAGDLGEPTGPRIVVSGLAFWGGVGVKRRPGQEELRRRKAERRRRKLEGPAAD